MLDSLRLLVRYLLIFVFLVSLSSALQIGVSPAESRIKGDVNERLCIELEVYSRDYNGMIIVEDRWSNSSGRNLNLYSYNSSFFDIDVIYNNRLESLSNQEHEVCFITHNEGKYSGVIIYETEGNGAGVGSWIVLDIGNGFFDESLERIQLTGAVIGNLAKENSLLAQTMLFIFLILILILSNFLRRGALKRNRQ